MGIEGLDYQVLNVPLSAGLKTKDDPRAMEAPGLSICADARFDDLGGIQTRFPFASIGSNIFGGGTLANVRRLEVVNEELVCFNVDSLYSWNVALSAWVLRDTHLAVNVTEAPAFATTGDQIDGDRAELNGTIVYAWTEGGKVYAGALDKATGSVLVSPTAVSTAVGRPRLVALATKILLFVDDGASHLTVRLIDPATPGVAIGGAGTSVVGANLNLFYDVVKAGSQDVCVGAARAPGGTGYTVFTVSGGGAIANSAKARTCDGPIAVSTIPDGTQTQIARGNGANIQGDLLTTSTLADVFTAQAIGSTNGDGVINQIAAAHRSVQNGGAFRCYVFWDNNEVAGFGSLESLKSNWVDNANALGTQAVLVNGLGCGSRAFSYNGSVYLWAAFGKTSATQMDVTLAGESQAQDAFLLYRDDAFIVAKAAYNIGGGFRSTNGILPGVALTAGSTTFSWIGTIRRRALLGGASSSFAARTPNDITFTFDSNRARRVASIGRTLYIAAGEVLQYDGTRLTECGFHFYPWAFDMLKAGTGSVDTGTYAYKLTWRWANAQDEKERSTTAIVGTATMSGGPAGFVMGQANPLTMTHKTMVAGAVAIEVWRTAVNPVQGAPFFLASSLDATDLSNPNKYIPNDPTLTFAPAVAWRDEMADLVLVTTEENPENQGVLPALSPPAASVIFATDTRVYLAGVSGQPDAVWYSRLRGQGEIVSFSDALVVLVPQQGGDITALAYLNETLVVFRQFAVYALPGLGFDNTGGGQNLGPANRLSSDVGAVSAESVALTPDGLLFKSSKGWYLLTRQWTTKYVGADVAKFDGDTVLAVHVVESCHQIRCVTNARILVFDYLVGNWMAWSVSDAVHATVWNGIYYYLSSGNNAPMQELTTFPANTVNYGLDVELGWIKRGGLQGWQRAAEILIAGEFRGAHALWIRTAYDYQQDGAGNWIYTDSVMWPVTPNVVGSLLQVSRGLSRGRCQAVKIRITAVSTARDGSPPTTEALKLTGVALKVGVRKTPNKRLPAAQKI